MTCHLRRALRGSVRAIPFSAAVATCGCGRDLGTREDPWPHIFDVNYGLVSDITPREVIPGASTQIHVAAVSRYSGAGFFTLEQGDGHGFITSPVAAPLGRGNCRGDFGHQLYRRLAIPRQAHLEP